MTSLPIAILALTVATDGILSLVVWLQSPNKRLNRIFALLTLSFMVWGVTGYFDQTASGEAVAYLPLMAGVPFVAGVFMAYFIARFAIYFPEFHPSSPRTRKIAGWLLGLTTGPLLLILVFNIKLMIAGVTTSATQGNNITPGPLYGLFPIYFLGWIAFALVVLLLKFRHSKNHLEKLQLSYVFLGFFFTTGAAFFTNVILPVLAHNPAPARFGFLSTLFLIAFVGYAIVAHRLFNVRLLIARSVAYLLLLTTLTGLYGLGIFAVSNLFFPQAGLSTTQISVFIVLAIMLAVTYQPLRRFFEKITDRLFFRDRYDSQMVLDQVSSILASELFLEPLLAKCLNQICQPMRLAGAKFFIVDGSKPYKEAGHGTRPPRIDPGLLGILKNSMVVSDELEPGGLKDALDHHGVRVALLLKTRNGLVGYLFLGDKLSGETYSGQDLALLEILRKELSVAIANAKAYEEIASFNATLQERIHQATQRLRSANRNLKVLDKAKDDFISMASHQLGTPLTAITGYLSMALDEDRSNMTPAQREYVNFALEASERMVSMSSDLLNVSRLSSGRFMIQRQSVDLNQLVEQEISQLRPAANRKGLKLVFEPCPNLPHIMIDESKTRQVIMNYIDNAIYYTTHGSITVELKRLHERVEFTVTDTGIGVPVSEHQKLFSKFYRATNAQAARPDGTGLGLYLAKQVVEDQGGSIIFHSKENEGSTFGFSLPL